MGKDIYRTEIVLKEPTFNRVIYALTKNNMVDELNYIQAHGVIDKSDSEPVIKVKMYGSTLTNVINATCNYTPDASETENHFTAFFKLDEEKKQKEEDEKQQFRDKMKSILRKKPYATGLEIAQELNVPNNRVYAIYKDVKNEVYAELKLN